jgi:hypothetical protein
MRQAVSSFSMINYLREHEVREAALPGLLSALDLYLRNVGEQWSVLPNGEKSDHDLTPIDALTAVLERRLRSCLIERGSRLSPPQDSLNLAFYSDPNYYCLSVHLRLALEVVEPLFLGTWSRPINRVCGQHQ